MHPTTTYWQLELPDRAAALTVLAQVRRLSIRPEVGGDLTFPDRTRLYFKDDVTSAALLLLLRPLGGHQIRAERIERGAVWATGKALLRALGGPEAPQHSPWTPPAPRPAGSQSGQPSTVTSPETLEWQPLAVIAPGVRAVRRARGVVKT